MTWRERQRAALLVLLLLAGCATTDTYWGRPELSPATKADMSRARHDEYECVRESRQRMVSTTPGRGSSARRSACTPSACAGAGTRWRHRSEAEAGAAIWIVTRDGFYSIVAADGIADSVVVRARDIEALRRLQRRIGAEIIEGGGSDYPCRMVARRDDVARVLADEVRAISYRNVKDAVRRSRGARYGAVMARAWSIFLDLQRPRTEEGDGVRENGGPKRNTARGKGRGR